MSIGRVAAVVFALVAFGVVAFQIALAAGAPLGSYAMGGAFPGRLPPALRVAAVVQGALILGMALVVLSRAGLMLASWLRVSRWLAWVVVGLAAVSLVLNVITPSEGERELWAPVAFVMLVTSVIVALQRLPSRTSSGDIG